MYLCCLQRRESGFTLCVISSSFLSLHQFLRCHIYSHVQRTNYHSETRFKTLPVNVLSFPSVFFDSLHPSSFPFFFHFDYKNTPQPLPVLSLSFAFWKVSRAVNLIRLHMEYDASCDLLVRSFRKITCRVFPHEPLLDPSLASHSTRIQGRDGPN